MRTQCHTTVFLLLACLCCSEYFAGCDTHPPVAPVVTARELGRLVVSSNVDGAQIFLDGENTGNVTPDTVVTTVGTHLVRVEKQGFIPTASTVHVAKDSLSTVRLTLEATTATKVVLIEDFSNVSCIPCVSSNLILHALVGGSYSRSRLVAIRYATNFPSPNDPFYTASQELCDSRMAYYRVLFAPTLIVDGLRRPTPADSLAIKDSINASLAVAPLFSLTVTKALVGSLYSTEVSVRILDTAGVVFANLVLHTVVVESDIVFSSPPGANGETAFRDIVRGMLPSADGAVLTPGLPGTSQTYKRSITTAPAWNMASLNTVTFVQDRQTKQIYQTGSTY